MGALNLLAKSAKVAEANRALPLRLARAAPKTQAEIDALATRVAKQINNEHVVSGKPNDTKNLAGRSMKENQRLSGLEYLVEPTGAARESVIYQPRKGDVNVAIPGDQTISDSILRSVGDIEGINSHQQGGARYGLAKMDMEEPVFWASGESAAQNAQNKFNDVGDFFNPERVIGQHMAMGPVSNNFAMHFADANLRAMDYSKIKPKDMQTFDRIMADGYMKKNPKTGQYEHINFPNWPGIADPEGALTAMRDNPEMRKWFNSRMKTPDVTQPLGLPNGLDIQWAITEPQLRNMEVNLTGLSAGEMVSGAGLTDTAAHNTYDKGIRGTALGHQEVLTPFTLSFPDAAQHIASTKNPADFTGTIQKVFPHQIVDDQWLDEVAKYRDLIKKYTGQKEGGEIHMSNFEKRIRGVKDEDGKASIRKIMALMAGMMGRPTDIASQTFKGRDYKTKTNPNPTTPVMPLFALKGRQYASGGVTESQPTRFDDGGAAFGVMPQMKPRRAHQDREASKNVPVDAARGFVAGALGAPGDLESLIRMLPYLDEKTILPTSEDIEKRLPFKSDTPVSRAATELGQLGGSFYTGPGSGLHMLGSGLKGAKSLGKTLAETAGERISMGQPLIPGVPKSLTNPPVMNIIKPEDGNWRPDNIERSLRRLKAPVNPDELLANLDYIRENGVGYASREAALQDENLNRNYQSLLRDKALDQWVDKNLTNYVKKQMGSEKDPVRLLADQGITHYSSEDAMRRYLNTSYDQYARNRKIRKHWGMPEEHIANTSMGRAWEEGIDDLMGMHNIKKARDYGNEKIRADNPWMEKLDPNSNLYGIDDQVPNNLQLGHIMDVLKEDLATGRMTPEDLKNVSMDRAVRRTHEYNLERAKAQESAQAKKLEGMTIHKEYPEGFKWVELNKPGQFAAESDAMGHSVRGYEPPINHPDWIKESGNAGSKSYGFGGWDAIKSGDAKIYSLIDKANRPHTTIEINKGYDAPSFYETNRNLLEDPRFKEDAEMWNNVADSPATYVDEITKLFKEAGLKEGRDYTIPKVPKSNINQIKGKGNRAPNSEYLPYVQDFVKSGDWGDDIGDLHYTGLKHLNEAFPDYEMKKYFNKTNPDQKYLTQQEIDDFTKEWNTPQGEKSGGVIKMGVGGLLKNAVLAAAREEALSKFPQFRKEIAARQFIEAEYKKAMRNVPYDQQVTLKDWEATRVLPVAERDANLAKMLEGSQIKQRLYHGTGDDIKEFRNSRIGAMGPGTYLAESPQNASGYSTITNRKGSANQANVMPVYVQTKNPFVISNVNNSSEELFKYFDPTGKLSDDEVIKKVLNLGYDSIYAKDTGEINVLDPRRIKSAIGNRGTYDITDPDINKAKGGIALGAGGLLKNAIKGAKTIQKIEAPNLIIPSDISKVKEAIRQSKGDYGARRVERAADEIPNLERLYQEDALKEAFIGDNARALMTMNPKNFEKYASPIPPSMSKPQQYRGYGSQFLDDSMKDMTLSEYIDNLSGVKGGFADVPYLLINKQEQGLPLTPFISGHEGRHRSRALANRGEEGSLVQLLPRAELREPFPRRSQEEYIEALKKELEMTDNMVEPQIYQESGTDSFLDNLNKTDSKIRRPAIKLPDIYAKGGLTITRKKYA